MPIKLDWEVESEEGREEIGEDPEVVAARHRRSRQIRNILIVFLLLIVAATGLAIRRLGQVNSRLRADLEDTIAAETLALRIGDARMFMKAQANIEAWRKAQQTTFDEYQSYGSRLVASGEIVDVDISVNNARVVLRETLDGQPYRVIWFYHHDDTGWYHIPSRSDLWGDPRYRRTPYFAITYYDADQDFVDALAPQLDDWIRQLCALDVCGDDFNHLRVQVLPDNLATPGWTASGRTLVLRSPQLDRQPEGHAPAPALFDEADRYLTQGWPRFVQPTSRAYAAAPWVEDELVVWVWLHRQKDDDSPLPDFFTFLEETYHPDVVPVLMQRMRDGENVLDVLFDIMTGDASIESTEALLAAYLRAEATLRSAGYTSEADLLFTDPEREPLGEITIDPAVTLADPDSIEVPATHQFGDLLWADVHLVLDSPNYVDQTFYSSQPFRLVDDRWYRTKALPQDYGPVMQLTSGRITLDYHEIDAPYSQTVLTALEEAYTRTIRDFGIADPLPVDATLSRFMGAWGASFFFRDSTAGTLDLTLPSPHLTGLPFLLADQREEQLEALAVDHLLHEILARATGDRNFAYAAEAIARRQKVRLGFEVSTFPYQASCTAADITPEPVTLDDLWNPSLNWSDNGTAIIGHHDFLWLAERTHSDRFHCARTLAADELLALLVETYGEGIIPPLVQNLEAESTEEWLRSAGVEPADIQAAWQDRLGSP